MRPDARSTLEAPTLPDVRCPRCKHLLLRGKIIGEIKCVKCKLVLTFQ